MPTWLMLIVLSLATTRFTRLVTKDDFPPILWVRDRLAGGWRPLTEPEHLAPMSAPWRCQQQEINGVMSRYVVRKSWSPYWLAELITCPWCSSAYIAAALVSGAAIIVGLPAPLLCWPAVWMAGALLASREWL
jgi:hypothetical protein